MVVCFSRARVVLYQLLSLINMYEMIDTRNSVIAYIIIYKFIIHLVCDYHMGGGVTAPHDTMCDCFWCVYGSVVNCHIWLF